MPRAGAKKETADAEPVAWENPLIPNRKLRAMYAAMVELRLLDETLGALTKASARRKTFRGEEGCRVSTTLDLKAGDLTSDGWDGAATDFLRGADLAKLLHLSPGGSDAAAAPERLPTIADSGDRLHLAMGAAFVLKTTRKAALLVAYVSCDEVSLADWKPMLRFVAGRVLPVIFVVLPEAPGSKRGRRPGQLSLASSKCGVPGIPVDAADPVALYRVAQESMLRARAGGGPVLIECIAFQIPGKKAPSPDPLAMMREFLLHRTIVDERWLNSVETRFTARLRASGRERPSRHTDLH